MGTFGKTDVGGGTLPIAADNMRGLIATSPADAEGATVSKLTFHCYDNTTNNVKGVMCLKSTLNILTNGIGDPAAVGSSPAWFDSVFSTPPTISANTDYVLMVIPETTLNYIYRDLVANSGYVDTTNSYTSPENPTDATLDNNEVSIYATYTPAAVAAGDKTKMELTLLL